MIVRLKGGLGNQMFQYAFTKQLEYVYGIKDILMDGSFYTRADQVTVTQYNSIDDFDVHYKKATAEDIKKACLFSHSQKPMTLSYRIPMLLEIVLNKRYYHVKNFLYVDPEELRKYRYLDGSWQCPKYFEGIEVILRKEFTYQKPISNVVQLQIDRVKNENSVFIGIRRGDYVKPENIGMYGELKDPYYNEAIRIICEKVEDPVFYVMSDDINWVKNNIHFNVPVIYREDHMIGNAHEEMMFMSACKHAIIPNSTFHWWGAWLINNPNKIVITPAPWFADNTKIDIVPDLWQKINRE